jgi:hypothetical protein
MAMADILGHLWKVPQEIRPKRIFFSFVPHKTPFHFCHAPKKKCSCFLFLLPTLPALRLLSVLISNSSTRYPEVHSSKTMNPSFVVGNLVVYRGLLLLTPGRRWIRLVHKQPYYVPPHEWGHQLEFRAYPVDSFVFTSGNVFIFSPLAVIVGVLVSTVQNTTSFDNFNSSAGQEQIVVPFSQQSGEGLFCFPVNMASSGVSGLQDGANVTIEIIFNGPDGILYQVILFE